MRIFEPGSIHDTRSPTGRTTSVATPRRLAAGGSLLLSTPARSTAITVGVGVGIAFASVLWNRSLAALLCLLACVCLCVTDTRGSIP
jgi:hypothetical protein